MGESHHEGGEGERGGMGMGGSPGNMNGMNNVAMNPMAAMMMGGMNPSTIMPNNGGNITFAVILRCICLRMYLFKLA